MVHNSTLIYSIYFTKNTSFNNLLWGKAFIFLLLLHKNTPPSYLQSILNKIFLHDLNSSYNPLILHSLIFITFGFPIWLECRRGFPGNYPPSKANVVLQDSRSHQRKDHKHFQHTNSCPRLHLIFKYFKCFLHFLVSLLKQTYF